MCLDIDVRASVYVRSSSTNVVAHMVLRLVALCLLCHSRGVQWVVENPSSSLMVRFDRFQQLFGSVSLLAAICTVIYARTKGCEKL